MYYIFSQSSLLMNAGCYIEVQDHAQNYRVEFGIRL